MQPQIPEVHVRRGAPVSTVYTLRVFSQQLASMQAMQSAISALMCLSSTLHGPIQQGTAVNRNFVLICSPSVSEAD